TGEPFSYVSPFIKRRDLFIHMKGYHQIQNAAVALMAIDYLKQYDALLLDEKHICEGLNKASWPGRFEEASRHPLVILDGAHNPESIRSLVSSIERYYADRDVHIMFAAMKDKDINKM